MKKLLAIMFTVVLIVAVAAVISNCSNSAAGGGTKGHTAHAVGNNTTESIAFAPWDGTSITDDGIYNLYLLSDLNSKDPIVFGDGEEKKNITVNLCLNGHKWDSEGRAGYIADGVTLNICNCSNHPSVITGKGDAASARGGVFQVAAGAALNLHSGVTVTCDNSQKRVNYGGVVELMGKMGIYGATVVGCETPRIAKKDGSADISTGLGGAISVCTGAELFMADGLITDGIACIGGNIYMESGASFIMEGGKIAGGTGKFYRFNGLDSGGNAGGIFVGAASFVMKGGEICGNRCDLKGAGVFVDGFGIVEISGNAKISVNQTAHTTHCGGVHMNNAAGTLAVSGTSTITGNTNANGAANVFLPKVGFTVKIRDLQEGAQIGITVVANCVGVITDVKAPVSCFSADKQGYGIVGNADGVLMIAVKEA